MIKLSRQRRYQLRMQARGCCVICGEPARATECTVCLEKRADRQRGVKRDRSRQYERAKRKRAQARKRRVRSHRPHRCSECGKVGHNRRTCVHVWVFV